MEDNKEYNGYKNRATWNAALWFNNDEYLYKQAIAAKTEHDLKVIFNSEIDMFKDFYTEEGNIDNVMVENIDWAEVYNNTGNREPVK